MDGESNNDSEVDDERGMLDNIVELHDVMGSRMGHQSGWVYDAHARAGASSDDDDDAPRRRVKLSGCQRHQTTAATHKRLIKRLYASNNAALDIYNRDKRLRSSIGRFWLCMLRWSMKRQSFTACQT